MDLGKDDRVFLPYFQSTLGMAEYRNGNFYEADAALLAAMESGKDNPHVEGISAFYRGSCPFSDGEQIRKVAQLTERGLNTLWAWTPLSS